MKYDGALSSNGGTSITSYNLQVMAAYTEGKWQDLTGQDIDTLLTMYTLSTNVTKGETYIFRYSAKNAVGTGVFSDSTTVVAADPPSKPISPPSIVGDPSATGATLQFDHQTIDDGGSPITSYVL